jgi:hypothetical protein
MWLREPVLILTITVAVLGLLFAIRRILAEATVVTSSDGAASDTGASRGTAGIIARPPLIFLGFLAFAAVLEALVPSQTPLFPHARYIAGAVLDEQLRTIGDVGEHEQSRGTRRNDIRGVTRRMTGGCDRRDARRDLLVPFVSRRAPQDLATHDATVVLEQILHASRAGAAHLPVDRVAGRFSGNPEMAASAFLRDEAVMSSFIHFLPRCFSSSAPFLSLPNQWGNLVKACQRAATATRLSSRTDLGGCAGIRFAARPF